MKTTETKINIYTRLGPLDSPPLDKGLDSATCSAELRELVKLILCWVRPTGKHQFTEMMLYLSLEHEVVSRIRKLIHNSIL